MAGGKNRLFLISASCPFSGSGMTVKHANLSGPKEGSPRARRHPFVSRIPPLLGDGVALRSAGRRGSDRLPCALDADGIGDALAPGGLFPVGTPRPDFHL